MSDVLERRVGGLTVRIDRLLCVGFGDCIEGAPETFELDAEGIASFRETGEVPAGDRLIRACDACPVDALTVLDLDGRQLAP